MRSTIALTPLTLVRISQSYFARLRSAVSSGLYDEGGRISIKGISMTSHPSCLSVDDKAPPCSLARDTRILQPASGLRVVITIKAAVVRLQWRCRRLLISCLRRALAALHRPVRQVQPDCFPSAAHVKLLSHRAWPRLLSDGASHPSRARKLRSEPGIRHRACSAAHVRKLSQPARRRC